MNRNTSLLQFKITLLDTNMPIWRRILIPATYRFWDLHVAIQDAMGWMDHHYHDFHPWGDTDLGKYIGIPNPDDDECLVRASWEFKVADVFSLPGQNMQYEYGMNDEWQHDILLEDILPREKGKKYPVCIDGEGACPPEDCGGVHAYRCIVTYMRGKRIPYKPSPEYMEMIEAAARDDATRYPPFSPDGFDIGRVRFDNPAQRLQTRIEKDGLLPDEPPEKSLEESLIESLKESLEDYFDAADYADAPLPKDEDDAEYTLGHHIAFGFLCALGSGQFGIEELRIVMEHAGFGQAEADMVRRITLAESCKHCSKASPKKSKPVVPAIYCLRISLLGCSTPIWRRLLLPNTIDLRTLHHIIMIAMGWEYDHYHRFRVNGHHFEDTHELWSLLRGTSPETGTILGTLLREVPDTFAYEYDFDGDWRHTVTLEEIRSPRNADGSPAEGCTPECVDGRCCCPPEEVGGPEGYTAFLDAISDPENPEHAGYRNWIGGSFDPEFFDKDSVNALLSTLHVFT